MREFFVPEFGPPDEMHFKEPACGQGHMAYVLEEFAGAVEWSDVHRYDQPEPRQVQIGSYIGDGLDVLPYLFRSCDWVITNPPFNEAGRFQQRARLEARHGVALLLRSTWMEGGERYREIFKDDPPRFIVQSCDRISMVQGRWDPKARRPTSYAWFVWDCTWTPSIGDRDPRLRWIPPGAEERNTLPIDYQRWAT